MNGLPFGYKLRPDGNYEKTCIFNTGAHKNPRVETIVRTLCGALVQVLRKRDGQARTGNHSPGNSLRSPHSARPSTLR